MRVNTWAVQYTWCNKLISNIIITSSRTYISATSVSRVKHCWVCDQLELILFVLPKHANKKFSLLIMVLSNRVGWYGIFYKQYDIEKNTSVLWNTFYIYKQQNEANKSIITLRPYWVSPCYDKWRKNQLNNLYSVQIRKNK